jgi:hypothetical protein
MPVIALAIMVVVSLVWVRRDEVLGREAAPGAGAHTAEWPVQMTTQT